VTPIDWKGGILEMPNIHFFQEISPCSAKWLMAAFPFLLVIWLQKGDRN
jgi:hypothetical protein